MRATKAARISSVADLIIQLLYDAIILLRLNRKSFPDSSTDFKMFLEHGYFIPALPVN